MDTGPRAIVAFHIRAGRARFDRAGELARLVALPRALLIDTQPARRLELIGLLYRAMAHERARVDGRHWAAHPARRRALGRALGVEIAALRSDAWVDRCAR